MSKVPPLVWKEPRAEKTNKLNLAGVSLDVASTYGSIPHQLIFFCPRAIHYRPIWVDLLKSFYGGLWSKSFSAIAPSSWHQHLRGIFTCGTASIMLFLARLNVVFTSAGIDISIFQSLPSPGKAFMDGIFCMSPSLQQFQVLLNSSTIVLSWARMSVKPYVKKPGVC